MDELEFEGTGQTFVEGVWRFETAVEHLGGVEFSRGAEFLDADRGDCQFLACYLCQEVEAV